MTVIISAINIVEFKQNEFWSINLSQALTIIIACCIAFWANQRITDDRRIRDRVERIIIKIQDIVTSPEFITFKTSQSSEEVRKIVGINTRKLTNAIETLKKYEKKIRLKKDIQYLEQEINSYRDIVSEKVNDVEYLSKSETLLRRYSENIDSRCDSIIADLYLHK